MTNQTYSHEIADAIKNFLDGDNWHYSFDKKKGIFRFSLSLSCKIKTLNYYIRVKKYGFLTYGELPIGADADDSGMMSTMAEFVCRANYGLQNGCFELDMNDGEIRFRIYVDCDELTPSNAVIKNSIYCTAFMVEQYAPGILDVIFSSTTAKAAVDKCEKDYEETLSQVDEATDSTEEHTPPVSPIEALRIKIDPFGVSEGAAE